MKQYAVGVDIGGTTVKIGLFETKGVLLDTWEIPTNTDDGGKEILSDIADSIRNQLSKKEIAREELEGIGMGVPGPVSADGVVLKCVNLGWGIFNVEEKMRELTGLKVKVGNDANVAALGEMWQGGGKGYENLVMVTLGTGVGGGVILHGQILSGINGAAGEIGHMPMLDDETEVCGCGKKGCLEQYASANGITRVTKKYLASHSEEASILRSLKEMSAKEIFRAAKEGDAVAIKMVERTADMLGKALAMIACVVDPEAFVIGGGMSKAGEILLDSIKSHYQRYAFHASREVRFQRASLGNLAGIYGGVKMVL